MRRVVSAAPAIVLASALLACATRDSTSPATTPLRVADAARGATAFAQSCSICHASGDGYDVAHFNFTDTTIVRRALRHVDTLTAYDIVAHIRSLRVAPADPTVRVFQPGGEVLTSDVALAMELFGSDHWPAGLTTAQLAAIDPRKVAVAVPVPRWADEVTNLDWMPDDPLPDAILDDQGQLARAAIAGYRAAPTSQNLARAVAALRTADRRTANPGAPCLDLAQLDRVNFEQCFQVRRWTATLVGQHFLRFGLPAQSAPELIDVFWDVGNVARKSIGTPTPLANATANWAAWQYLAWTFDPSRHPTVYTGGGLHKLGLDRHATFLALRSEVARPAGSVAPYDDVASAVSFAPNAWAYDVLDFGYRHLLERIAAGDVPRAVDAAQARDRVHVALTTALRKVPSAQAAALTALQDQILASIP